MKSPGGSMFPYYYKGGEIHCLKYGSNYSDTEKLFELMKQEEEFILHTNRRLKNEIQYVEIEKKNEKVGNKTEYVLLRGS
ncbi:hypothetical protein [Paenibacillus alvei]|uniref:Uncharacterized protein n=1 Tax=Paenibacillus alvei TaxID=44250 RepID=A0A383R8S3_PAEAL|nr:hypothetical protein [Paenibacillus alvei]SYX83041.1 protein of unknown function [Paenibacillus alvei]